MQRKANLGEHLTGWGLYETGLIVFPLACYLLALLGFGAAVNGENTVQRNALLYHRLALRQQVQAERELAPPGAAASAGKDSAAEAEAGCGAEGWWGGSATGARRAGAPLSDADDALQICAELVLATEPLRAFGCAAAAAGRAAGPLRPASRCCDGRAGTRHPAGRHRLPSLSIND